MADRARKVSAVADAESRRPEGRPTGPADGSIGRWEWEIPSDRLIWSAELSRIYGFSPERHPGTYAEYLQTIHPDDREILDRAIRRAARELQPFVLQHRVVRPDGTIRMIYAQGLVVAGDDGRAVRMVGLSQDITALADAGWSTPHADALQVERHLERLLDRVTDGFVSFDREWRYVYANRRAGELFGRDPASLVGHGYLELYPEAEGSPFHRAYQRAMAEQVPQQLEAYYAPWRRWFENRIYPGPDGLSIFFTDITERKRLEAERREAVDRLHEFAEHIDEVVYIAGPTPSEMLYVSPAFERLWGIPVAELLADPQRFVRAFHPEDREAALERLVTRREEGWDFEYRIVRPDGEVRWIRDRGTPIRDETGRLVRVVGVADDVTEARAIAGERERLLRQLEAVVQQMPSGVLLAEAPSGRVVLSNRHFERLISPELAAQPLERVEDYGRFTGYRPDTGEQLRAGDWPLARAVRHGETVVGEEIVTVRADGVRGTLRINAAPIRDSGGHVVAAVATLDDVTDRRQRDQLVQAQEQVLEMVAGGDTLEQILTAVVRFAEEQSSETMAVVNLLEDIEDDGGTGTGAAADLKPPDDRRRAGRVLRLVTGPNLPAGLRDALAELPLDPEHGTCPAAMLAGTTVVARDVATDPHWAAIRPLLLAHGIRSSWSAPIRAAGGAPLGTFALYARRDLPDTYEVRLAEGMAHIAGLAIDRRRTEHETSVSMERYRLIARATSDVVYDWDLLSDRLTWSDGVYGVFRYPTEEPVGSIFWWEDHLHPDDRARVVRSIHEVIDDGGHLWTDEYRFRRGDGTYVSVYDRGVLLRDADGRAIRMLGSMLDVSEREDLELQLRQAQKMEAIGQLAGGVAHDFNNLLTAIRCSAEFLLEGLAPADSLRRDVEEIEVAAERAASLTRQLLAFSRRQVIQPQRLDVNAVVAETEQMLRRMIGEDIHLVVHADPDIGPIRMDRGQLQQVLLNLAINARDAMPEGGAVVIETGAAVLEPRPGRRNADLGAGEFVRLTITDTGVGMDRTIQARIFDPFFTTKPVGKGTGLGLSTVYGIVRQAGGRITVESEPGRGTTFAVFLPLDDAGASRGAAPPSAPAARPSGERRAPGTAGTVLLVEDDKAVRVVVRRVLQARGYAVLEARNGKEALELAAEHPTVDLVISDVVMPEMGGRELVERLAVERPGLRILLMSGYTQGALARQDTLPAHVVFMEKPFVVEELLARLAELLAR